jgi:ATP-dependent Clp protease ATP-binding subunit ClpA
VNLKGWRPHQSAREMAEERFLNAHGSPHAERILGLVGGRDPETLRRLRDERKKERVLLTAKNVETAFEHAKLDAREQGLTSVTAENMFNGLLRESGMSVALLAHAGLDLEKLRSQVRYGPDSVMVRPPEEMTANPELSAILLDAKALAEERNHEVLNSMHVMHALIRRAPASVLEVIESAGGTKEKVLASIEQTMA